MRKILLKILKITKAYNIRNDKAIIYHPISVLLFILLIPPIAIACMFMDKNIIDVINDSFTFKLK